MTEPNYESSKQSYQLTC